MFNLYHRNLITFQSNIFGHEKVFYLDLGNKKRDFITLCKEDTLIRLPPLTHQLLSVSRSKDSLVQEPLLGESLLPMTILPQV